MNKQSPRTKPCVFTRASRFAPFVAAAAIALLGSYFASAQPAEAAGAEGVELKQVDWSFAGPFGTFDRDALRRGFQAYKEVCASCHAMSFLHYRNLGEEGGPEFSEAEVKAIAAEYTVEDGPDDQGDMFERAALPRDRFVSPFPNQAAARVANGGAYPVDLSLIAKARPHGPDYVYSLLTGYDDPPPDLEMQPGMYYNEYFSGGQIAMAPPILEDIVEYSDGTPATEERIAMDVVTFLMWAAEPKLEQRHQMGFNVMIYLIVLAGLLYFATRKVWSGQH